MLTNTFIHAPGIGPATERSLWQQNVHSWSQYAAAGSSLRLPPRHRATLDRVIGDSLAALADERVDYFARSLATPRPLARRNGVRPSRLSRYRNRRRL